MKRRADKRDKRAFRTKTRNVLILFTVALVLTMAFAVVPKNYTLTVGDIAPENIYALREVEDETATKEQRQRAREAVSDLYTVDGAKTVSMENQLQAYFDGVDAVRQKAAELIKVYTDAYHARGDQGAAPTYENSFTDEQWQTLIAQSTLAVDKATVQQWIAMPQADWDTAKTKGMELFRAALSDGLREADVADALTSLTEQAGELEVGRAAHNALNKGVQAYLAANSFYDAEATEQARVKAENAVAAVVYKKGQVIVRLGDVVTQRQIDLLRTMGMLAGGVNVLVYLGVIATALAGVAVLVLYLMYRREALTRDTEKVGMICLVMFLVVLICALLQRVELAVVPVSFAAIVVALTIDSNSGAVIGCLTAVLCAAMALAAGVEPLSVLMFLATNWICSLLAASVINNFSGRSGIVTVGVGCGVAGALCYGVMGMLAGTAFKTVLWAMGAALLSGVIAGIFCLGSTPVWESFFHALTPMKLMELCNPTNPLLKRLMFEAPGTYHHSVMVGNLAEAAADALGANALLARVGSYYHDVGKLAAPRFFSENQPAGSENPHDRLTPIESARLIARHPHDGAAYILEQGMARPIADIALQHHGSSVMAYFYYKAKEQDGQADIRDYRHTGGRPRTVEAALVMLADSCEAATRATGGDYKATMRKIVRERLDDGQLDLVRLTLKDLDVIVEAFESVLKGAYHGRIQYPDAKKQGEAKA